MTESNKKQSYTRRVLVEKTIKKKAELIIYILSESYFPGPGTQSKYGCRIARDFDLRPNHKEELYNWNKDASCIIGYTLKNLLRSSNNGELKNIYFHNLSSIVSKNKWIRAFILFYLVQQGVSIFNQNGRVQGADFARCFGKNGISAFLLEYELFKKLIEKHN